MRALLEEMDVVGALVTTDVAHTCAETARYRINRWTTWAAGIDDGIGLPHATHLAVIRRDVANLAGQPVSKEIFLVVTSRAHDSSRDRLPYPMALGDRESRAPASRHHLVRRRPARLHRQRSRTMTTVRNLALGLFSLHGIIKIKQMVGAIGRNPLRAVPLIT